MNNKRKMKKKTQLLGISSAQISLLSFLNKNMCMQKKKKKRDALTRALLSRKVN
jgi:hypothetical protein